MPGVSRIDEDDLEQHLERIINSDPFSRSKRLVTLLKYVVWRSYSDSPEFIRAYDIAIDAFDRGSEFDPEDPYIRNIAKLTRKALDTYYQEPDPDDWIKIDLPPGNFVTQFTVLDDKGRVRARTAAASKRKVAKKSAASEDTKPDLKETKESASKKITINLLKKDVPDEGIQPAQNGVPIDDEHGKPLLGIIPFTQFGTAGDDEALGDILANSLIAAISPSTFLNVVSRLSTTHFKNMASDKAQVTAKLNTDYILTGHYQVKSGELVLTVELSAKQNDQMVVLWADTLLTAKESVLNYSNDLFPALVHSITAAIERHEIQAVNQYPYETLAINRLIICGANYMHCGPERLFKKSRELLLLALKKQPNHPTVNALLAQWSIFRINRSGGWSSAADKKHQDRAWQYCDRALENWSSHALALTTYGLLQTQLARNPEKGLQYYATAEKFDPNEPLVHAYKAAVHAYFDRGKEAVTAAELALKLSPFDPQLHMFETCMAAALLADDKLEDAEVHAKKAYELNNNHTSNLRGLISVLVEQGKVAEAKTFADKLLSIDPGFNTSSYRSQAPNSKFRIGERIAKSLEIAGIPCS